MPPNSFHVTNILHTSRTRNVDMCLLFFVQNQELRSVVTTSQKKERSVIQEVLYRKTVCAALRNASLRRVPYAGDYQLPSSPFYQRPTQPALQALGSSGHEKKRAREKETRDTPRVSPSRAPVLSFAHYFQAPATQPPSHRDVLGASWRVLASSTFVQQI